MDPTVLKIEFEALFEAHIDLDYTGFDTVEIENVLEITSTAPGEGEELDYGKLGVAQPAITRPGDVWRCVGPSGEHRIACCDARDGQQLRQLFAGETAQVGVHDLPYNVPLPTTSPVSARRRMSISLWHPVKCPRLSSRPS